METVQKRQEEAVILEYPFSSLDDEGSPRIQFEILGQTGERSYEDRSVYLCVKTTEPIPEEVPEPPIHTDGETVCEESRPVSVCGHSRPDFNMWLNGEDAIELGLNLIEQGKFALESNMINHQAIHTLNRYRSYLREERIEEVQFRVTDDNPPNYGQGFRLYKIIPIWKEEMAPEYNEDFTFDKVIYWSPFEEEYADQLDYYTLGTSYSFDGYDRADEVRRFKESVRLMSGSDV
jgi:hypothetical protein